MTSGCAAHQMSAARSSNLGEQIDADVLSSTFGSRAPRRAPREPQRPMIEPGMLVDPY